MNQDISQLTTISGPASSGKTSRLLEVALDALESGSSVAFFSKGSENIFLSRGIPTSKYVSNGTLKMLKTPTAGYVAKALMEQPINDFILIDDVIFTNEQIEILNRIVSGSNSKVYLTVASN